MTIIQAKKQLVHSYFTEALRLRTVNGNVDDYDICRSIGNDFESIANLKLPILSFLEHLIAEYNPSNIEINGDCICLLDECGMKVYTFSFILTPILSFSGNVGINEIEYDGGVNKHMEYLSLFFPEMRNIPKLHIWHSEMDENSLLEAYVDFYRMVCSKLENNPMSLYNLLTGIKKHYNLLDDATLLETDGFSLIDFTKLKDSNFINSFSDVELETSDTSPMLKISFQGCKLLHIRTKSEKKNSKFKLRFFIETSSKFLRIFTKGN